MMKRVLLVCLLLSVMNLYADDLLNRFRQPPEEASPWIFWYWMNGAVTKEGITADLEAMKEIGLAGTYLMPIRDSSRVQFMPNSVLQMSSQWWEMLRFSMQEADRLGLKMGMHICDGFALAGGPWITPEESMKKIVYADTLIQGGKIKSLTLPQPEKSENYYRDVAVFALPMATVQNSEKIKPKVSTPEGEEVSYLLDGSGKYKRNRASWIQYEFEQPFTARSMTLTPSGTNFQALRLRVAVSDDGQQFRDIKICQPARRGWQDTDAPSTYTLPETTARYFRFYWTPEGTEPGAEDLDAAKWKVEISLRKILLSSLPQLENYEGKSGLVWRLSKRLAEEELPATECVSLASIVNLTEKMDENGVLHQIDLPRGQSWLILRMGQTSTGHRNDTGGGAKGLECDKFDENAVKKQLDNWFGAVYQHIDNDLLSRVLTRMHADSWECGSQNWSNTFLEEFRQRRQYDLLPFLPLYAGIPIESVEVSEAVLYDIRKTIAELLHDVFFATCQKYASQHGCEFSSESVAPTMLSDGMYHYSLADLPMGEFWLDSPTHDKPNDMFDAISAGHVYGKNIIQAEGYTQLRGLWNEYPGMIKALGDKQFALGMNKLFFHVYCHHPFPDKYPGMTLDGIGLYMQRGQTWWPYASEWLNYIKRCQSLLQYGVPVRDIAVFTGENLPSRSVLPDKLVKSLPGLFGQEKVTSEEKRLRNEGTPVHSTSVGVTAAANMVTADLWTDPLRGYQYDAINADALLRLASVKDGRMVLPGGASYKILVLPMAHPMAPDKPFMSREILLKIKDLQAGGVLVLLPAEKPSAEWGYLHELSSDDYQALVEEVWQFAGQKGCLLPYLPETLDAFGLSRDLIFYDNQGKMAADMAWNHRRSEDTDCWFVSNQQDSIRQITISIRQHGNTPEYWDTLTGEIYALPYREENGRTIVSLSMNKAASCFIVMRNAATKALSDRQLLKVKMDPWTIAFPQADTICLKQKDLFDWRSSDSPKIKYYAGTADYSTSFTLRTKHLTGRVLMVLEEVNVVAKVRINGQEAGILWAAPYELYITDWLKNGCNQLDISVANTWYNYAQAINKGLISDKYYWTNARIWKKDIGETLSTEDLQPSGLMGEVKFYVEATK